MEDINRYFEILGLKPGASLDEVKEAYLDLVKVWHPDRFAHDPKLQQKAQEKLKEINDAFQKVQDFLINLHKYQQAAGPNKSEADETKESAKTETKQSAETNKREDQSSKPPPKEKPDTIIVYAGFWRRFIAFVVDICLCNIAIFVIVLFLAFVGLIKPTDADAKFSGIGILVGWLFFAGLESSGRQDTWGKRAMGIIVTDMQGNRISFGRATGRFFGKYLSALLLLIGYIMAGVTKKKQALHDIIASCVVINVRETWFSRHYKGISALLIGLPIIGILAAIGIPYYVGVQERARMSQNEQVPVPEQTVSYDEWVSSRKNTQTPAPPPALAPYGYDMVPGQGWVPATAPNTNTRVEHPQVQSQTENSKASAVSKVEIVPVKRLTVAEYDDLPKKSFTALVIKDHVTGLMWTKDANLGDKDMYKGMALDFVDQLNSKAFAGYKDWRLPTVDELTILARYGNIKASGFTNVQVNYISSNGASIDINDSRASYFGPNYEHGYVWPVRSDK